MTASGYKDFVKVNENVVELDGGDGCRLCEYTMKLYTGISFFFFFSFKIGG